MLRFVAKELIMQTWITDKDFYKSASNLTKQHLQANIYESIQILASLLNINDKLVNPKKNVDNYPQARLWSNNIAEIYSYINIHLSQWFNRGYKTNINGKNLIILSKFIMTIKFNKLNWITDELIQTHRSVLIQKEINKEYNLNCDIQWLEYDDDVTSSQKYDLQNDLYKKISRHYRNLWPDCPRDLKMRYDWRGQKHG
jgi:hypothetical protein